MPRPFVVCRLAASFVLLSLIIAQATFVVEDDTFSTGTDHVRLKVLSNRATNEMASIIITAGGGVDALRLAPVAANARNASLRDVIWDHNRNATEVLANPTWKGRMLLPYANRIGGARYAFNGTEFHLPINGV